MKRATVALASGLVAVLSCESSALPAATIYNLGTLGGTYSSGISVNAAGQVAGASTMGVNPKVSRAFRFDGVPGAGGVMRDLGTLDGTDSWGQSINSSGQVAGYSYTSNGLTHAFRYDGTPGAGGIMHDLGTLGGPGSGGYAINDSGQVAGSSGISFWTAEGHVFRYDGTPALEE